MRIKLPPFSRRETWADLSGASTAKKPFNDVLRVALKARPNSLRRIADKLINGAEEGNLQYIREIVDRLDGRPVQMIDRHDVVATELTDAELIVIAAGGRAEGELEMKVIPPMSARVGQST